VEKRTSQENSDPLPFFSIITISFNNIDGLRNTHESVINQDFENYEWLVVDGGSSDGTDDYLSNITDERLRYVCEADDGIYDAMRKGVNMASGEYLIFMNSGDVFAENDVLSSVIGEIKGRRPQVIYGDSYERSGDIRFYKPARKPSENRYVMFTHHQSIFYKRKLIQHVGFDMSYRISGDWVMTTRVLAQANGDVYGVPIPISTFERGGISQSKSHRRIINREHFRIYREEQGHSFTRSCYLWIRKVSINKFREIAPGLYDIIRYRSKA
jgi:putative colanic acid biosynthesis glycosyltransferase